VRHLDTLDTLDTLDVMRSHSTEWLESRRREVVAEIRRLQSEEHSILLVGNPNLPDGLQLVHIDDLTPEEAKQVGLPTRRAGPSRR
jgi:hypothetical protein